MSDMEKKDAEAIEATPEAAVEGQELSDDDLETVAGGLLDTTVKTCIVLSTGASAVVI